MKIHALIVAHDEKLGIGKNHGLPWRIKQDMKHFRDLTINLPIDNEEKNKTNVVIMGRKTWESLPANFRPLPNRINLVITRSNDYRLPPAVLHSKSIEDALSILEQQNYGNIFVIGGAAIYQMAIEMNIFDTLFITEIDGEYNCDVFFPAYRSNFELVESSAPILEGNYRFVFKTYKRKP